MFYLFTVFVPPWYVTVSTSFLDNYDDINSKMDSFIESITWSSLLSSVLVDSLLGVIFLYKDICLCFSSLHGPMS